MFNCSTCSELDIESGLSSECSSCRQSECQQCLDDEGVCVPCGSFDF